MSRIMMGTDVAKAIREELIRSVNEMKAKQVFPAIAIVRVGADSDNLAYEKSAKKQMEQAGIACRVLELPDTIEQEAFEREFRKVNEDPAVHGILLFRPLPKHLNEEAICRMIDKEKDIDCIHPENVTGIFTGDEHAFAPCTAEAVIRMLEYYEVPVCGANIVVVGRSMVIGKPVSMMLLKRNATVTICHTKTRNLAEICRRADIIVAAAGKAKMITEDMVGSGCVVVDVGINVDENGNLCGDVDFENVREKADSISPVPKGIGSITTSVLAQHVVRAVHRQTEHLNP